MNPPIKFTKLSFLPKIYPSFVLLYVPPQSWQPPSCTAFCCHHHPHLPLLSSNTITPFGGSLEENFLARSQVLSLFLHTHHFDLLLNAQCFLFPTYSLFFVQSILLFVLTTYGLNVVIIIVHPTRSFFFFFKIFILISAVSVLFLIIKLLKH